MLEPEPPKLSGKLGRRSLKCVNGLLIGKTRDENRHVRGKAEALGRIGDERALKALEMLKKMNLCL